MVKVVNFILCEFYNKNGEKGNYTVFTPRNTLHVLKIILDAYLLITKENIPNVWKDKKKIPLKFPRSPCSGLMGDFLVFIFFFFFTFSLSF